MRLVENNMKNLIIILSLVFLGSLFPKATYAQDKGAEFKEKYLFTHSFDPNIKEHNDVISKACFKVNPKSLAALQSYNSCIKIKPGERNAPLNKALGECTRNDKASAYFFETKEDCEEARKDTASGAAT